MNLERKKDLEQIIAYLEGEENTLTESQKFKLDRMNYCADTYTSEIIDLQHLMDMVMIKFKVSISTARLDIEDCVSLFPKNRNVLRVEMISKRYEVLIRDQKNPDKAENYCKNFSKHIKIHEKEEKEEVRVLPSRIIQQYNLNLLNVPQISENELNEAVKLYLKPSEPEPEINE